MAGINNRLFIHNHPACESLGELAGSMGHQSRQSGWLQSSRLGWTSAYGGYADPIKTSMSITIIY